MRPLSARSAVLSVLLGVHPPELSARHLVGVVAVLGVSEATVRVALTRMVAAGDLLRVDATYRLSPRLVERQGRQDTAVAPATRVWRGAWEIAVVATSGRPAAERAELRSRLLALRLAELREGVWLRPANLRRPWPRDLAGRVTRFTARPDDDPASLVATLWDLTGWASTAEGLVVRFEGTADPAERLTVAAACVRHLLADPVLPPDVQPHHWPAPRLREVYLAYRAEVGELIGRARYPQPTASGPV